MANLSLEERLVRAGIRLSPVRILVARVLDEASRPLSSLEIEAALDTVDRSSITRTLALFAEARLLHSVEDGSGAVKYEMCRSDRHLFGAGHDNDLSADDNDRHPHFHCRRCGMTICLPEIPMPVFQLPEDFLSETVNIVIKGLCGDCRNRTE